MKNSPKNISLLVIILLIIIISVLVITKKEKVVVNDNYSQRQEKMETKEKIQGSGLYSFDTNKSQIIWEGKKTFIKDWIDVGNISINSGNITLENNEIINGEITIDMNSITAQKTGQGQGQDSLSKHLKSEDFFNTKLFPTSKFILTSLTSTEKEYEYQTKGDITIKDITKNIEFPMSIYKIDDSIKMTAEIVLDRTLFDIRFGSSNFFTDIGDKAIDNNFILRIELIANKS